VVHLHQRPVPAPVRHVVTDGLATAGLDVVGTGVAILAADGRLLQANAALYGFIAREDGLGLDAEGLFASDFSARSRLGDAIWMALAAADRRVRLLPRATRLIVPRRSVGAPWIVEVRPLPAANPGAIVLVTEPRRPLPSAADLRAMLGLQSEAADLALALAAGTSTALLARRRGVAPATLRRHMAKLRRQTGCGSTAELIGLVLALGG
jgi:DNA-binding CsgD family transcriptional regulator